MTNENKCERCRKADINAIKGEMERMHKTLQCTNTDLAWVDTLSAEQARGVWLAICDNFDAFIARHGTGDQLPPKGSRFSIQ